MNTIWKLISIASFGLLIHQMFFEKTVDQPQLIEEISMEETEELISICEEMPRFPGCEYSGFSKQERKSCADKKLIEFIYSNIKFPKEIGCVEAMAVVQFTIRKDGSLSDIKILRSLSPQINDEIFKMLNKMPNWIPGKQAGKAVNIRYNLPIKFRLE